MKGKITKILANFYYVTDSENNDWECFARARLLKEGKFLFVGDTVEIETTSNKNGVIVDLINRKNKISKPPVANIDQVLVVFSASEPELDFYNLDRYLSFVKYELPDEKVIICINKIDLKKINIDEIYKNSGFDIVYVSCLTDVGLSKLEKILLNKTTVLTGPSGVGKSTIIKKFAPEEEIAIGTVSAIKQGKHITRNVQLITFKYNSDQGFLVDSPGFTQFSFGALDPYKILNTFNELKDLNCAFSNCLHNNEEGCQIELLNIPESRLESYHKILEELQSEVVFGTKEETKIKSTGGKKVLIPKIKQELRAKSRKRAKQDLLRFNDENEES